MSVDHLNESEHAGSPPERISQTSKQDTARRVSEQIVRPNRNALLSMARRTRKAGNIAVFVCSALGALTFAVTVITADDRNLWNFCGGALFGAFWFAMGQLIVMLSEQTAEMIELKINCELLLYRIATHARPEGVDGE